MGRLPAGNSEVVNAALSPVVDFTSGAVPSTVEPFLKVTVPVGTPETESGATVAVKVTGVFSGAGLSEDARAVELNCLWVIVPFESPGGNETLIGCNMPLKLTPSKFVRPSLIE
jgi:hypothetical protein